MSGKTGIAVLLCSTGVADGTAPWKQVTITGGDDGMNPFEITTDWPRNRLWHSQLDMGNQCWKAVKV